MNKEQDYASDSDESDEDFRPDAPGGELSVSEEESNGSANEEEHEGGDESTKQNVRKSKKLTKKASRKNKRTDQEEDDDSDEDPTERRCTRQQDEALTNGKGKSHEKDHLDSDEEDKSRTNALWADFLMDVKPAAATKTPKTPTNQETASSSSSNGQVASKTVIDKAQSSQEPKKPSKEEPKKVTVTEILDFAGEEVRVQKEIDASSIKENKAAATTAPKMQPFGRIMPGAGIKRPAGSGTSGGLGSLLNQIGKKKKISVLEKSQMDWKSFKTDEGIDEQLQTFNKGKNGYLERQDFLQRTDLRQFEIEKNLRQTSRRPH